MISSGEVFLLNSETSGELKPLPAFLNRNIRVLSAGSDRAFIACEKPVNTEGDADDTAQHRCSVWCFKGDDSEPVYCDEFDVIEGRIRQIAIGSKHLLVLTYEGVVYSRGTAAYGCLGHGGAKEVPEFHPVKALQGKQVKFVAAGPAHSIAITHDGDVYAWGQAFQGETGLFSQVEAVPRFAPAITPFCITEVSCGHGHVLARTEGQKCISWGENTCGQLGIGQKSKSTYKPQLLDIIPSQVAMVSAGWSHSTAIGTDGRVYTWGLNSHGQLGLGDTQTRMAPHLLHSLVDVHEVKSIQAASTFTVFLTASRKVLLTGQVPARPEAKGGSEFSIRRPTEQDPPGCLLAPIATTVMKSSPFEQNYSELEAVVAFNRGALAFAASGVYKVAPNLAPTRGGTVVRAYVTGLPYEEPNWKKRSGTVDLSEEPLIQDTIPVKVRLRSPAPSLDVVVPGKIVDINTVEFITPDVGQTPLGSVVESAATTVAVQIRVSIDGGFTWTMDRQSAPTSEDLDSITRPPDKKTLGTRKPSLKTGLNDLKSDFEVTRAARQCADLGATVLWITKWPSEGPVQVEPCCSPAAGGAEILLHVPLPSRMPADMLTVKFVCTPLESLQDKELEAQAPLRREANEVVNGCKDAIAALPLATPLEVPVVGWLDVGGHGVRCITPPLDPSIVNFYSYSVELSLDGGAYFGRALPFYIFDLNVTALEPNLGSLHEETEVIIRTTGFVDTDIQCVKLSFPVDLGWPARVLPAAYDRNTQEVSFMMPDLTTELRDKIDEERRASLSTSAIFGGLGSDAGEVPLGGKGAEASPSMSPDATPGGGHGGGDMAAAAAAGAAAGAAAEEGEAEGEGGGSRGGTPGTDQDGGLGGLEVFVELSLNGQNFTEDRIHFTYHPTLVAKAMEIVSHPEGCVPEPPKEEPKGKKPAKGGAASAVPEAPPVPCCWPGSVLGVELANGLMQSDFACFRVELVTKVGDEDYVPLKVVDVPAKIESVTTPAPTPPPPDPKAPAAPPPVPEEPLVRDLLVASAPGVHFAELPLPAASPPPAAEAPPPTTKGGKEAKEAKDAAPPPVLLFMRAIAVSLNGRTFTSCPPGGSDVIKLEPLPPEEATAEGDGSVQDS